MLTSDLARATVRSGKVSPRFVDIADDELLKEAEELIAICRAHIGKSVERFEEAIDDHIGDDTDYLVRRGLVKLLRDRSELQVQAALPPAEIRRVVFQEATVDWPVGPSGSMGLSSRSAVIQRSAARMGLSAEAVELGLYADLKSAEVLIGIELPEPQALLQRYNLALAQALLLRAKEVVVELVEPSPAQTRELFRIVKFHRLMHRAERLKSKKGWRLTLDGPLSLFRQTQRYGLQLALFLPALCHCPAWRLKAEVAWGKPRRLLTFQLDQSFGLSSHTRQKGNWESEEERHFRKAFKGTKTEWTLRRSTRIIDLDGRGVLVPDYVLSHPDGRRAFLDLVWFWRRRTFQGRLELLGAHGPSNLIVALATRLNAGEDELPDLDAVVPFKGVINPKKIIAKAEEVAC